MSPIPSQASKKGGNRFRKSNYHEMWFIAFQSMFCLITKAHKALPMQLQVWNTSWCLDLTLPKLPLWWPIVICQYLWNVIFFNSWKKLNTYIYTSYKCNFLKVAQYQNVFHVASNLWLVQKHFLPVTIEFSACPNDLIQRLCQSPISML